MIRCLRAVPADAGVTGAVVSARAVGLAAADDLGDRVGVRPRQGRRGQDEVELRIGVAWRVVGRPAILGRPALHEIDRKARINAQ